MDKLPTEMLEKIIYYPYKNKLVTNEFKVL